ncbi:MAG: HD domain-containing protein [Bryobacteraceae bacterium]|nr:HD domain-containing protein [Bryobacteraceae bacterium]
MDFHRIYELRCPVHGFIALNAWEREIVDSKEFQRLRRIRQLAWTDQVYPGAMHNRFEHSLGVMHVASMLFGAVVKNSKEILVSDLGYNDAGFERDRQLVRLAALLHDEYSGPNRAALEPRGLSGYAEAYSAAVTGRGCHNRAGPVTDSAILLAFSRKIGRGAPPLTRWASGG